MKLLNTSSILLLLLVGISGVTNAQRAFGGGKFGNRPGFPGLQPDLVSKTCDAQWECPLRPRRNFAQEEELGQKGIFVCRQTYHPIFGTQQMRAKCILPEEAYETDECGCCGEDCPQFPTFQAITCDGTTVQVEGDGGLLIPDDATLGGTRQRRLMGRRGGNGGGNRGGNRLPDNANVVCRQHYNPYTGDPERMSMYIDPTMSLEGDTCGCCDNECPEDLDGPRFARPDHVQLNWCNADADTNISGNDAIPCALRRNNGQEEGVFVCRSMANMLTGVAESQTVCISPDRAWESDQCGCCGQDCPEHPLRVDLECTVGDATNDETATSTQACPFRNGEMGIFACRSFFHPLDGTVIQRTLCLKDDDRENDWSTDSCGCCGGNCPATPEGGFPRVDRQMMQLSLEEDDTTATTDVEADFGGESRNQEALAQDDDSDAATVGLGLLILAMVGVLATMVQRYARNRADKSTLPKY